MYEGTFYFGAEKKPELKELGVEFTSEPHQDIDVEPGIFKAQVRMTEETLKKLDSRWGEFIWSLDRVEH